VARTVWRALRTLTFYIDLNISVEPGGAHRVARTLKHININNITNSNRNINVEPGGAYQVARFRVARTGWRVHEVKYTKITLIKKY